MKNDFYGKCEGQEVKISVPPTLLMTAVARVQDIKKSRTADFKLAGDSIYLLGPGEFGLLGSELSLLLNSAVPGKSPKLGLPRWEVARQVYSWMGGARGKTQSMMRSVHDVSEGGVLVSVAECLLARGFGATLKFDGESTGGPQGFAPWEFFMGEGFHSFIVSASEGNAAVLESEWNELKIPYRKLGVVETQDRLLVQIGDRAVMNVGVKQLRSAWLKEGFWD
jgi:phosphoribosylformylglycinamidine synthase